MDQGGRRVRVASCQQQLRARRVPPPAGRGQSEPIELLEPPFCLVEASAPQECHQRHARAHDRLDRKAQRHPLREALIRDGQATVDLSGLHVPQREILIEHLPDPARCPSHGPGPFQPRECVADVAEVEAREGSEVQGIHFGFDAPHPPGGLECSLCVFDTGSEVAMPVQILRPGVQGPCQLLGRGVAGVLDGKPDRLLRARSRPPDGRRWPRRSRRGWPATGRGRARASPPRYGAACASAPRHPARLPTRPGGRRARPAGGRREPGRRGPGPRATVRVRAG